MQTIDRQGWYWAHCLEEIAPLILAKCVKLTKRDYKGNSSVMSCRLTWKGQRLKSDWENDRLNCHHRIWTKNTKTSNVEWTLKSICGKWHYGHVTEKQDDSNTSKCGSSLDMVDWVLGCCVTSKRQARPLRRHPCQGGLPGTRRLLGAQRPSGLGESATCRFKWVNRGRPTLCGDLRASGAAATSASVPGKLAGDPPLAPSTTPVQQWRVQCELRAIREETLRLPTPARRSDIDRAQPGRGPPGSATGCSRQ